MSPLAAWLGLPRAERFQFLAYWFALRGVRIAITALGVGRTQRWLGALSSRNVGRARPLDGEAAQRLAHLLTIAGGRGVMPATCLPQALLLQTLLRRRGHDGQLRIGVRRNEGATDAHAWVEVQGVVIGQVTSHVPFDFNRRSASAK